VFTLPLIGSVHFSGLNILPILLAVVFFLQQKYTPKPPATTPEQETQQKMMLWMSVLLFPIIVYNGPAGLNHDPRRGDPLGPRRDGPA
jgi:membrane protein insertase Oxa1/YidC/SpoIIIJ